MFVMELLINLLLISNQVFMHTSAFMVRRQKKSVSICRLHWKIWISIKTPAREKQNRFFVAHGMQKKGHLAEAHLYSAWLCAPKATCAQRGLKLYLYTHSLLPDGGKKNYFKTTADCHIKNTPHHLFVGEQLVSLSVS